MKQRFWNKLRAIISRQKPFPESAFSVQSAKVPRFCRIRKIADLFTAIGLSSFASKLKKPLKLKVFCSLDLLQEADLLEVNVIDSSVVCETSVQS